MNFDNIKVLVDDYNRLYYNLKMKGEKPMILTTVRPANVGQEALKQIWPKKPAVKK